MPLELLRETPKARAAFWSGLVLVLTVHINVDIFLHLTAQTLLCNVQVAYLPQLLAAGKIFEITHRFGHPSVHISRVFHKKF